MTRVTLPLARRVTRKCLEHVSIDARRSGIPSGHRSLSQASVGR